MNTWRKQKNDNVDSPALMLSVLRIWHSVSILCAQCVNVLHFCHLLNIILLWGLIRTNDFIIQDHWDTDVHC